MKEKVSPTQKVLNIWAIILVLWSIYRGYFKTDLPIWFDEFIAKPLLFLIPIYWYVKYSEKVSFFNSVGFHAQRVKEDLLFGFITFVLIGIFGFLGLFIKGKMFPTSFSYAHIVFLFIISFGTAVSEEIVSRGFLLNRFLIYSHNKISSVFLTSILFFILHIPILFTNTLITGKMIPVIALSDFVLSITVSILFIQRKSIILPICIHAFYLMGLQLFIG